MATKARDSLHPATSSGNATGFSGVRLVGSYGFLVFSRRKNPDTFPEDVAQLVKRDYGGKHTSLAAAAQVHPSTVGRWVKGTTYPHTQRLEILKVLGLWDQQDRQLDAAVSQTVRELEAIDDDDNT